MSRKSVTLGADKAARDFFLEKQGRLLMVSDETFFYRQLQMVLSKALDVKKPVLAHVTDAMAALDAVRSFPRPRNRLIVFVERILGGIPSAELIFSLKKLFPSVRLLVLTDETERGTLISLHESGADNVLTKPASANDIIEKIANLVRPPAAIGQLMEEGKELLLQKRLDEAAQVGERILAIKPKSPAGLMLLGDCFAIRGAREKAVECYLDARESSKYYLEPIKRLAEVNKGVDDAEHLRWLRELDRLSPRNIKRKYEIGRLLVRMGRLDEADTYLEAALEQAIKDSMAIVDTVAADAAQAVTEAAPELGEKYLRRLFEFKRNVLTEADMEAVNLMGIALRRQGKWREALDHYGQALAVAPGDENLHYNMGVAYAMGRQFTEALACFDKALEINPRLGEGNPELLHAVAKADLRVGRTGHAREILESCLSIDPADTEAQKLLAELGE